MHVGYPGNVDVKYTVEKTRYIYELIEKLNNDGPELQYFKNNKFQDTFKSGIFNCWGVPERAEETFNKTNIGDLVLIIPEIGIHGGGVSHIGIIEEKCPFRCYQASHILWPNTPFDRLFPHIFFFKSEEGFIPWDIFLNELGISKNWNPRGWYRKIDNKRFNSFNGPEGLFKIYT